MTKNFRRFSALFDFIIVRCIGNVNCKCNNKARLAAVDDL